MALVDDGLSHPPPTSGTYDYVAWKPGAAGWPGVNGTYTDPTFSEAIKVITAGKDQHDNYSKNGYWNSNNTRLADPNHGAVDILTLSTSARDYVSVPTGNYTDHQFSAINPDLYYYLTGTTLRKVTLGSPGAWTDALVRDFSADGCTAMVSPGGSVDWVNNADIAVMVWTTASGTVARVYDIPNDILYTGAPVIGTSVGGYVGITPGGGHVWLSEWAATYLTTDGGHISYVVDTSAHTLSTTAVLFWSLCGSHVDGLTASDGKDYLLAFDDYGATVDVYRVDMSLTQTWDASGRTQQRSQNGPIIFSHSQSDSTHTSCVSTGTYQNWGCMSFHNPSDDPIDTEPGDPTNTWRKYKAEIVAINVQTQAVQRLVHHRSRSGAYYNVPRHGMSWDGSQILWSSNFNSATDINLYAMAASVFAAAGAAAAPTTFLFVGG